MNATTTIPIGPGWLTLICLAVAAALIAAYLPSDRIKTPPALERFKDRIGYKGTDGGLFLFGLLAAIAAAVLWLFIAGYLLLGIAGLIHELISSPVPPFDPVDDAQQRALWNWRFKLAQMAALATLLSAVIALPITLNRLRLARQQTRLADETLFNQKITEAAADLHAQRQITIEPKSRKESRFNGWEDDIVRRNAAIDRLEGLLRERSEIRPDRPTAERLARLLSVYVRELSREHKPETHLWFEVREIQRAAPHDAPLTEDEALERLGRAGEDASLKAMRRWAGGLRIRSDMENAVRVLGRLGVSSQLRSNDLPIDLENCNLQGARLAQLDLQAANLSGAKMQGAVLSRARMQGADLSSAEMQGADLFVAEMQGADLRWAEMQGAVLGSAEMQGADLRWAEMQGAVLVSAEMQGAVLSSAEMQGADLSLAKMQGADLRWAEMQGAVLSWAKMQGANLSWAKMDDLTDLSAATLRGAALRSVDETTIAKLQPFWNDIFADGTILPDDPNRPAHWATEELTDDAFKTQWHTWMREDMGMDLDNPR